MRLAIRPWLALVLQGRAIFGERTFTTVLVGDMQATRRELPTPRSLASMACSSPFRPSSAQKVAITHRYAKCSGAGPSKRRPATIGKKTP